MSDTGPRPALFRDDAGGGLRRPEAVSQGRGALHGDRGGIRRRPPLVDARSASPQHSQGGRGVSPRRAPRDLRHVRAANALRMPSRPTTISTSSASNKDDPARLAGRLRTRPWTVAVDGEVHRPQTLDIDALLRAFPARGARLPDAVRRGLVHGHPLGRIPARQPAAPRRADVERAVRRVHDPARPRADAGPAGRRISSGPTSRGCASTRRCTR